MRNPIHAAGVLVLTTLSFAAVAHDSGNLAKPEVILHQSIEGMPVDRRQDVRVLTATFQPGDRTVTHTHRHPVTVYVLEGTFTLELDGQAPIVVKTGEAYVEPPHVTMTGYNRSADEPTRVVVFYVSTPETPFLDMNK